MPLTNTFTTTSSANWGQFARSPSRTGPVMAGRAWSISALMTDLRSSCSPPHPSACTGAIAVTLQSGSPGTAQRPAVPWLSQEAGPPPLEAVGQPVVIDGAQALDVIIDVVDVQRN